MPKERIVGRRMTSYTHTAGFVFNNLGLMDLQENAWN